MILTLLKAKIHRATVTQCDLDYEGSISIDATLMKKAGIVDYERVDVLDITNGARFTTYAIPARAGSGIIGINGAAAHLAHVGDLVIIVAYVGLTPAEAKKHKPIIVQVDNANRVRGPKRA